MNRLLATCLVTASASVTPSPTLGVDPMSDWAAFYSVPYSLIEDEPIDTPPTTMLVDAAPTLGPHFRPALYHSGNDNQVFAAPREADADNPTYRQAMASSERKEWEKAIEREMTNLRGHDAIEPILEDTLSSWDPKRGSAREVVGLLHVLKKKYVDGIFDKYKDRIVYDGRMQKYNIFNETGRVLDTFAPAARHTTHKLAVAHATQVGGSTTTLSSRAYIERIAAKYLDRPLESYPKYTTPADPKLAAFYQRAVDQRADVDPELVRPYSQMVGALIYSMPASRVDCAYAIGMCARCLTFPTTEMHAAAVRILVYLARTADLGITFDASNGDGKLTGYVDSDWCTEHSTSGWCIFYGNAAIGYGSKRQHSIALFSTEAEIMAASQAAAEIVPSHPRSLGGHLRSLTVTFRMGVSSG